MAPSSAPELAYVRAESQAAVERTPGFASAAEVDEAAAAVAALKQKDVLSAAATSSEASQASTADAVESMPAAEGERRSASPGAPPASAPDPMYAGGTPPSAPDATDDIARPASAPNLTYGVSTPPSAPDATDEVARPASAPDLAYGLSSLRSAPDLTNEVVRPASAPDLAYRVSAPPSTPDISNEVSLPQAVTDPNDLTRPTSAQEFTNAAATPPTAADLTHPGARPPSAPDLTYAVAAPASAPELSSKVATPLAVPELSDALGTRDMPGALAAPHGVTFDDRSSPGSGDSAGSGISTPDVADASSAARGATEGSSTTATSTNVTHMHPKANAADRRGIGQGTALPPAYPGAAAAQDLAKGSAESAPRDAAEAHAQEATPGHSPIVWTTTQTPQPPSVPDASHAEATAELSDKAVREAAAEGSTPAEVSHSLAQRAEHTPQADARVHRPTARGAAADQDAAGNVIRERPEQHAADSEPSRVYGDGEINYISPMPASPRADTTREDSVSGVNYTSVELPDLAASNPTSSSNSPGLASASGNSPDAPPHAAGAGD